MKLSHLIKTGAVIFPVLAAALPGHALAATQAAVTLQCNNFVTQRNGLQAQPVFSVQAGGGVTVPATCAAGSNSCAQCIEDLLNANGGLTLVNSFVTTAVSGTGTPYFIFKK